MARIVHFLHRIGSRPAYRERAEELVHRPCPPSEERGEEESWVRVVECFQPSQGAEVADLALSERELPEVISVMHEADEVHVHGLNLEVTLRLLPYVHPESLRSTPLVIHGPVPTLERELEKDATRFQAWPGPVIYDALAEREAEKKEGERIPVWLDQSAAELLPRPNGAKPLVDDQGNKVAVISLEADLPATFKTTLEVATGRAIEAKGKGTTALRLEFRDEERCSLAERSRERRVSQVAIGRGGSRGSAMGSPNPIGVDSARRALRRLDRAGRGRELGASARDRGRRVRWAG